MELQIYYYENLLSLKIRPFCKVFHYENLELSHSSWSPTTTSPSRPCTANCVFIDGPPDQVWLPWMVRFAASGPH